MVNTTAVNGVVEGAQSYFYDVLSGIVILLAGLAIGLLAQKFLLKIFQEIGLNKIMSKVGVKHDLEKWVSTIISYVIYLITIVLFLDKLGIKSIVLYIVVGAVIMLLVLTLLVGLKDIIPNFMAWLFLQRKEKIKVGKTVEVKEIYGVVEKIGYLETEIKTPSGDVLYVPNSLFLKSKFRVKE